MVYSRERTIDGAFFALSHPVRRAMLDQLSHEDQTIAEISHPHALSPAQITKHVAILERAQLVKRYRRGRAHCLTLQPDQLHEIMQWVERYQRFWSASLDALDEFLANDEESDDGS